VNRIPREWNTDTIQPLIIERYPSTVHVTRIFHDDQPTNRIRIDFHCQDDVTMLLMKFYVHFFFKYLFVREDMHRNDNMANNREIQRILENDIINRKWKQIKVEDIIQLSNDEFVPVSLGM
jgi:magnesium-transporting ATPase (P-type)